MKERIAILDGVRTPFCRAGGALRSMSASDLAAVCVKELVARAALPPEEIDEVIFGNVAQPVDTQNIARVISLKAGLAPDVIAHTVHRNCASGMEAVSTAAERLLSGRCKLVVAGGTESMSNIPLLFGREMTATFGRLQKARNLRARLRALRGFRVKHLTPIVGLMEGLSDPVCGMSMGETAEVLADEFHVTRPEQDAYALASHQRACAARQDGRFTAETVPIPVPPDYAGVQETDDGPRDYQTLEQLERLRPYFRKRTGSVTVGNACQVTDGASALLVTTESHARALGVTPLGYLRDYAYAGLDAHRMGLGPAYAMSRLEARSDMRLADFHLIELNEAFAAQVIANERAFESPAFARDCLGRARPLGTLDRAKMNVNGGAIALGHPVGTTGNRLLLTLLHEMRRRDVATGLATLCVGGGQGAAFALEAA